MHGSTPPRGESSFPRGRASRALLLLALATPVTIGATSASGPGSAPTRGAEADASAGISPPNILLLLADDVGHRDLGVYSDVQPNPAPAITPNVDFLAATGLRFTRMHSNPVCSPTRATILTGRHANAFGLGTNIDMTVATSPDLPLPAVTLPDVLSIHGYDTAAFGKWHLSVAEGPEAARLHGFDTHRAGSEGNLGPTGTYFDWDRIDDGVVTRSTTYSTLAIGEEVIAWMGERTRPWFAYVAFHAPHGAFHVPPAELLPGTPSVPANTTNRERYDLMLQSLDTVIGRILPEVPPNTVVLFLSDNGTPPTAIHPLQTPGKVKRSVYREGIEVPCIAWSPDLGVARGDWNGIAQTTDLYATILELAGARCASVPAESMSFASRLFDNRLPSDRDFAFSERTAPNGSTAPFSIRRAATGPRYKLVQQTPDQDGVVVEQLFDLVSDPGEEADLLDGARPLSARETSALEALRRFVASST